MPVASLKSLETDERSPPDDPASSIQDIMAHFQSVGDNCEFGLVQRQCGCEPLGLLRFTSSSVPQLIDALASDFGPYGAPGDLELSPGTGGYHWCTSRRYAFAHNTNLKVGTVDPAELLKREYTKIAFLKRNMLEDLAEGHKILVRKGPPTETVEEFLELAAAIRRHGPSICLRVETAPSPDRIGQVYWYSPGIMRGYVRRFSPYDGGMTIDLEPWATLCRNAYRLATGVPAPGLPSDEHFRVRSPRRAVKHVTRHKGSGLSGFPVQISSRMLALGSINVFSAWLWIPSEFRGDRVFGFVKISDVHERLGYLDADLSVRDTWQRVWISAQVPARPAEFVAGIAALATGRQSFWSTDWRIGQDPYPRPAPPPSVAVGRGIRAWLFG